MFQSGSILYLFICFNWVIPPVDYNLQIHRYIYVYIFFSFDKQKCEKNVNDSHHQYRNTLSKHN